MRRTRFDQNQCPIARTADLLGDWWTPLVLRELLLGRSLFNEIQERLDVNRSVLSQRLGRLENEGIIERHRYSERPPRDRYEPTAKGRALWDVLSVMWAYGDTWLHDQPAPVELYDDRTGEPIRPTVVDASTGWPLDVTTTRRRLVEASPDAALGTEEDA